MQIQIHDKTFVPFISEDSIQNAIKKMAKDIQNDLKQKNKPVYFLGVLNGAFRLMADLVRYMDMPVEVGFLRLSSYQGTESTGKITLEMPLPTDMAGKEVYIIEDIIDTGTTLAYLTAEVAQLGVSSCKIVSLFFKPSKLKTAIKPDYIAYEIADVFIVGYGLDYDGLGRELNGIYRLED